MRKTLRLILIPLLGVILLAAAFPLSAQAEDIPDEAYVCCIYGYPQSYNLSCEARAAADWVSFFGYSVTEYELMASFPISDDPEEGFVGSWNGTWGHIPPNSYGIHPPAVAATLRELGVPAQAYSNLTWDDLRREIAAGRPVVIWVIAQMWPGTPIEYTAKSGNTTIVAYHEHAMILTGYSETSVQVVDPGSGSMKYFSISSFLTSWAVLGNRAVLAGEPEPTPTPTNTPTPTQTPTPTPSPTPISQVVVQAGDTLVGIAEHYGIAWQTLVALNNLEYPYFIHPGDVLRLY
ncbi:C39 family peptidase [Chloroflexota bacterium]|nr:C39 family peptidase [Chloroflexota bacterium]